MISLYQIKPKFQQLLKPILVSLHKLGVTANMITWAAILISITTGITLWLHPYGISLLLLPISLLIRMALNALDGMMARTYNMQSRKGEILNELGDVVSDLCMFIPLIHLFSVDPYIFLAFIFLSILNEFTGILGKAVTGERRYEGPMGKSDRALVIGLISLILYFTHLITPYLNYTFIGISVLLVISTFTRIRMMLK